LAFIDGAPAESRPLAPPRVLRATAADLFRLADDLNRRGQGYEAEQLLDLLAQDPNSDVRNEARYRRSKLLEARGKDRDAALLLRRILDDKPGATPVRLELAQLLDQMGDKDGAWREVRAAQAAGLPPAVARLVDRYSEALRAARPMGVSFEIAIAPDSNISRATRSDTLGTVFGDFEIDEDSKATSGTGLSLQGQAFRRFPILGDRTLLVRGSAFANLYRKTRFNDVAFDLAAGPELQWGDNRLSIEAGATERLYGQKPFQRSARIGATWTRPLGRLTQLRLNGSAALVDNQMNDLQDGKAYSTQVSFERALSPTTGVGLTLGLGRQSLKDPGYSTTGWRAGLLAWRDIGRATVTAEVQYGRLKADDRLVLFPDKRSERYSRFTIGATFRRLAVGGFAPVTRLVIERNRSTIEFYDYRRTRTEFGVTRAF
jgi:hypothetical protein